MNAINLMLKFQIFQIHHNVNKQKRMVAAVANPRELIKNLRNLKLKYKIGALDLTVRNCGETNRYLLLCHPNVSSLTYTLMKILFIFINMLFILILIGDFFRFVCSHSVIAVAVIIIVIVTADTFR